MRNPITGIDWRYIISHQPRRKITSLLFKLHLLNYNAIRKKTEDGLILYYFRSSDFPTVKDFIQWQHETFDVALGLKGDIAVDIGAHVGAYALRLAKNFTHVYAFEPNPLTFKVLTKNIEVNAIQNVIQERIAVSDRTGITMLHVPDRALPGTSIADQHYDWVKFTHDEPVRTVSLDDFFTGKRGKIGFVKIDVENHEMAVLRGMKRIIAEHHPILSVEVHHRPDTLTSCNCNVCTYLRQEGLSVELHGRYTDEMNAHWVIAQ